MNASLCIVSIKVTNMEEASDFYCHKLGFKLEKTYSDNIIELSLNGFPIILEKVSNINHSRYEEDSQILIGLRTENLEQEMKNLKERGVTLLYNEPKKCLPGYFTVIIDPFGNKIELLEFSTGE